MKKIFFILTFVILASCQTKSKINSTTTKTEKIAPISDKVLETATIYEVNIRQYSQQGTFKGFTKDIPQLKKMGVDILWIMPIYPISVKDRKGSLGSYYAIQNYTKVNPNFGDLEDVKNLVKTAHDNGLYVIFDWVANHTGRDNVWLKEHPDFYVRDKKGNPVAPFDWTDVAKLDYSNPAMRKAMIHDMKYWLTTANIDGFRCDVASEVPTDFWENAVAQLKKVKPIFMLAEAEKPELLHKAFDMQYGWNAHHIFNEIAQGKTTVKTLDDYMVKVKKELQPDDIDMYFTSNHDENSWKGTVFERLGDAAGTMAALTYALPGMPLIYDGQEYGLNHRLKFFEKDSIPHTKDKMYDLYTKLNSLKANYKALNGGKKAGSYTRIKTSNDASILAFNRVKKGDSIIFVTNLTDKKQSFKLNLSGNFEQVLNQKNVELKRDEAIDYNPWEYHFLVKK